MKHINPLAWLAFIIVCTVWGTTYLGIRVAIEGFPTFLLVGLRFTIAGAVLLTACAIAGQKIPRRLSDWGNLTLIGLLLVCVGNVAVVWAEHFISSGLAALLVATAPFWMATIEALRPHGERLTRGKAMGMVVGFAGVAILVAPAVQPSSFDKHFLLGVAVLQLGSICWNLGSVRSKYHPIDATPLVSASIQMLTGGVIMLVIGLAAGESSQFHVTTRSLVAFLYLMIFGSIVAYAAYVYALSKIPTSTLSLYSYVNPAVAVVVGWIVLREPLGWRAIIAMIVIFAGVAVVQRDNQRDGRRKLAAAEPPIAE